MKVPPSSKTQRSRKESKAPKNDSAEIRPSEKSKKSSESQQVCAACLFQISSASQDYCSTECSHHYHEKCLEQWLKQKNTCCLCRQKIKKYSTKTKGQITVPERVERRSFFDLLIPFESIDNQLDFPDIVFYHSERHPWILLSNNHMTYHQHRPSFRNHFIFSIGGSSSQNLNEEERPARVVESDNSQEVAASRRVDSQPFETAQNNNRSQVVVEVAQRARPRRKIVRKSNKTSKRVTRSSTKKSSSKNNPRQAKPKSQAKTLKKNKATSRK